MRKFDEMFDENSCFSKALDKEMIFVLLGRDKSAPETIRFWVKSRIALGQNKSDDPKILEALQCAETMECERGSEKL